jgi:hypothetical protein
MVCCSFLLGALDGADAANHEGGQHGLQVGAGAERLVARPDHHTLVVLLGHVHRQVQALGTRRG